MPRNASCCACGWTRQLRALGRSSDALTRRNSTMRSRMFINRIIIRRMARGRKVTLTPDVQEKILQAITGGNYRIVAATWAGIPSRTFHRWCAIGKTKTTGIYADFWQALLKAERAAEILQVGRIIQAAALDPDHAKWWLERKFPKRWGRKE